jgi:predicted small lipoprotein YifL
MPRLISLAALALLAAIAGCGDRSGPAPTAPPDDTAPSRLTSIDPISAARAGRAAEERLARRLAVALADPAFRTYLKGALDGSPVREHKLHFQRLLRGQGGPALAALARAGRESESAVIADAATAAALELYLPVPAHRAAWRGDDHVLVATARADHDAPVAFDVHGNRQVLSAGTPPATPVLALVPVETDFGGDSFDSLLPGPLPPPPPPPPPPPLTGLFMTAAHFRDDFEGWLKGNPEYELHVLGQSGSSDSLTSYQCVGEHAGGSYAFDQNDNDWSGSVLVFSQAQFNAYKSAHPNQNVRILALEDDDGACQIRLDGNRFKTFQSTLQSQYPNLTGGKDSVSGGLVKIFKRANALQKILRAAYSFITSQDDLIGNAIEDTVVGEFHAGANWIVRGESNVTNGWLKLQMK